MGIIVWRGKSAFDGVSDVAVIVTEGNKKTGDADKRGRPVYQVWVMDAAGRTMDNRTEGRDTGVCPIECKQRITSKGPNAPKGGCYVMQQPIGSIDRATRRGSHRIDLEWSAPSDTIVRMCAYGDPGAIPSDVYARIIGRSFVLGYTHAWKRESASHLRATCVASCDGQGDAIEARAKGWRTFTARRIGAPIPAGEIQCPAVREIKPIGCADCKLCSGEQRGKASISIEAHGPAKRRAESALVVIQDPKRPEEWAMWS